MKYAVGDTVFILDRDQYSIDQLSDLYHARWGIEELYKVPKRLMEVEDFHGQSERGVKQELYACFTLIAMTQLFANHGEDPLNGGLPNDGKPLMQTNFKHGLAAVEANIESLLLQQASALRETVARMVGEIVPVSATAPSGPVLRAAIPKNRSESGTEEGEHRHRQSANGIKNQRITKAQDRILSRMAKFTKRMPLYGGEGGIRTLDGISPHTPLAGERLQPLGHLSIIMARSTYAKYDARSIPQLLNNFVIREAGAPDRIRTCNPQFRRLIPYPIWPRARFTTHLTYYHVKKTAPPKYRNRIQKRVEDAKNS